MHTWQNLAYNDQTLHESHLPSLHQDRSLCFPIQLAALSCTLKLPLGEGGGTKLDKGS